MPGFIRLAKPRAERVVWWTRSEDDSIAGSARGRVGLPSDDWSWLPQIWDSQAGITSACRDFSSTGLTHFLLLNNDAAVAADFFGEINRALAEAPNAGLLTGTIYRDPQRTKVWYAGGREIRSRGLIEHFESPPSGAEPVPTEFVSGCVMLISRQTLDEIGLLPDCYFPGYMEDAEYSLRAREAGLPVLYAPRARAFHKVGATAGAASASPFITQALVRHRVLYVRRNFRGLERLIALGYLAITKPGKAVVETLAGRPRMGIAVLKGAVEGFVRKV